MIKVVHVHQIDPELLKTLNRFINAFEQGIPIIKRFIEMSAELDTAITTLQGDVAGLTDVVASAEALMTNLSQLLADAIAAAANAGATPAQLQALTDLHTAVSDNEAGLAAAVAANTPAAPAP